ncbi:unnamed protein product [Caretta caretta]
MSIGEAIFHLCGEMNLTPDLQTETGRRVWLRSLALAGGRAAISVAAKIMVALHVLLGENWDLSILIFYSGLSSTSLPSLTFRDVVSLERTQSLCRF